LKISMAQSVEQLERKQASREWRRFIKMLGLDRMNKRDRGAVVAAIGTFQPKT